MLSLGLGFRVQGSRFIEIVKGLGANNVLCETFCAKVLCESFVRNVLGSFFFGTTFCIWGWVLGRVKGLGWPGLCETFCAKRFVAHGFAADCEGGGGGAAA